MGKCRAALLVRLLGVKHSNGVFQLGKSDQMARLQIAKVVECNGGHKVEKFFKCPGVKQEGSKLRCSNENRKRSVYLRGIDLKILVNWLIVM